VDIDFAITFITIIFKKLC